MSKILYIGNLPFTTTAAELTGLVKPFGEVISALNGIKFQGRDLKVNESTPRATRKDQSWKDKDRMDYEDILDE